MVFWPLSLMRKRIWDRAGVSYAVVFAVPMVIALLFVSLFPTSLNWPLGPDYRIFYEPGARSLLAGDGYRLADGRPVLVYPPGFSVYLAGAFWASSRLGIPESTLLLVLNSACFALGALALFAFAQTAFGRARAFAAAAAFVTYPFLLYIARLPCSEIVFIVPFYGALALLGWLALGDSRSWPRYFTVGVLLGIAMLVRPMAIGAGVVAAFLLLTFRRFPIRTRAALAVALLAGNICAILPWEAWAYRQSGRWLLLSSNGPPSAVQGFSFGVEPERPRLNIPKGVETVMQNIYAHRGDIKTMGDLAKRLGAEVQRDPAAVAELVGIKALRAWYALDSRRMEKITAVVQALYLLAMAFCSVVAFRRGGTARMVVTGVWVFAGYFWLMSLVVLPLLRYMVPVMGPLTLALAAALPERFKLGLLRPEKG